MFQNPERTTKQIYSDLPIDTVEFFLWKKEQKICFKNNIILGALISRDLNQFLSNPATMISSTYHLEIVFYLKMEFCLISTSNSLILLHFCSQF